MMNFVLEATMNDNRLRLVHRQPVPDTDLVDRYLADLGNLFKLSGKGGKLLRWLLEKVDAMGYITIDKAVREQAAGYLDTTEATVANTLTELHQAGLVNSKKRGSYQIAMNLLRPMQEMKNLTGVEFSTHYVPTPSLFSYAAEGGGDIGRTDEAVQEYGQR